MVCRAFVDGSGKCRFTAGVIRRQHVKIGFIEFRQPFRERKRVGVRSPLPRFGINLSTGKAADMPFCKRSV